MANEDFNEFLNDMEIDLDILNINEDNIANPDREIMIENEDPRREIATNEDHEVPDNAVLDGQQNEVNQLVQNQPLVVEANRNQLENEVIRPRGTRGNRRRQRYRQVAHPYSDNRDQMASFIGAIMDAAAVSRLPLAQHHRGRGRGQHAPLRSYRAAYAARGQRNGGRGIAGARGNPGVGGLDVARSQLALRGYRAAYAARGNHSQPAAVPRPANEENGYENDLIRF